MERLINADALCEEFKQRQKAALRWKEKAILDGDEERQIRADATLAFLTEVKLTIDKAQTIEPCYQTSSCLDCANYDKENHSCPRFCENIREATKEIKSRPQGEWIPVSERLPEERLADYDFNEVLCSTTWRDVRAYKFGRPLGYDKPHFWFGGNIMDGYVVAWQPLPEPYKREAENAPTVKSPCNDCIELECEHHGVVCPHYKEVDND